MKKAHNIILLTLASSIITSDAATIVSGNVTTTLGPDFFLNDAATGGMDFTINQPGTANLTRDFGALNVGAGGTTINISGIAWASPNSATTNDATSAEVTITYLGLDGAFGGGDDVLIGSVTDNYVFTAAGTTYVWAFDSPMSATIDGLNSVFRVAIAPSNATSDGSLRFKAGSGSGSTSNQAIVKISVAGTSVAVVPEPSIALLGSLGLFGLLRRRR
jgi:hypothetical protein